MVNNTDMQAGRYKAYPEYKNSGVEWLGEIPSGWEAQKLKFLCTYNDEVLPESTPRDKELIYVDIGSVSSIEGITNTEAITYENSPSRARRVVRDGDVIISTVRTYLEAIAPINNPPENMVVSTGFAVIRPATFLYKGFASYSLRFKGFIGEVVSRSVGVSYPAINSSDLVNIEIPTPPVDEQKKIANFLDYETAKIDTLIEKQQRLIELLSEKRQAVISHAVTKGLNPDVPMKDSGIEWLGEVPEHWELIYSKWVFRERNEKASNSDEMLTASQKYGVLPQKLFMELEQQRVVQVLTGHNILKHVEKKDFVISMRSFQGGLEYSSYSGAISSAYVPLEATMKVSYRYFKYLFKSKPYIQALQSTSNLVRDGQALRYSNFIMIDLPIFSYEEAESIGVFLDNEVTKIDNLILKAQQAIQLMQERRTALISAAVTGKIDVRDWVKPE